MTVDWRGVAGKRDQSDLYFVWTCGKIKTTTVATVASPYMYLISKTCPQISRISQAGTIIEPVARCKVAMDDIVFSTAFLMRKAN